MSAKNILVSVAAALTVAAGATPVLAHHSGNAEFDTSKENRLVGQLVEMKDINPHSRWLVTAKGPDGKVQNWEFEGVSPSALRRGGVKVKEEIRPGDTFTFIYAPAWNGSNMGLLTSMIINGRTVVYVKV